MSNSADVELDQDEHVHFDVSICGVHGEEETDTGDVSYAYLR